MRSKVVKGVTAVVLLTALVAVALGLSTPDGAVRTTADPSTSPSTTQPSSEPTASTPPDETGPDQTGPADPASLSPVTGTWPGRPDAATESGGVVDWCPAVQVDATAAAVRELGEAGTRAAACRAVAFTFDVRYSRLALPRQSFTRDDFSFVLDGLTDRTAASTYPARVDAVIASPRSTSAREGTGLVLLDGPTPGAGRTYFGEPWGDAGYADRPVWVDPTWSVVHVDLQRGGRNPLATAQLEASAGVPVWNSWRGTAEKLTVRTTATYVLAGLDWRVNGWTLATEVGGFAPLG